MEYQVIVEMIRYIILKDLYTKGPKDQLYSAFDEHRMAFFQEFNGATMIQINKDGTDNFEEYYKNAVDDLINNNYIKGKENKLVNFTDIYDVKITDNGSAWYLNYKRYLKR